MSMRCNTDNPKLLNLALNHMVEALQILDRLKAPGDIGCHLDLAIARLKAVLGDVTASSETILANLSELEPLADTERGTVTNPWSADCD